MNAPQVSFVSLGCAKNLVDSEKMLGLLSEAGCALVADGLPADVMVVNTCGFLSASRDEAVDILREAAARKRDGSLKRLVVAGCLVQRDGQGLIEDVPEIDALVGVNNRADVVRAVLGDGPPRRAARNRSKRGSARASGGRGGSIPLAIAESASAEPLAAYMGDYHPASWIDGNRSDRARLRLTPRHYAYLRISEGCDQKCTFCTIPSIRGPMHCKSPTEILDEARELFDDGAVELNLIGQDTTSYGRDIGYAAGLAGLLRELDALPGAAWIRLMYVYPTDFTDEMIAAIAECARVVKYIDIPLQHIDDRILKAMYRRVTRKQTEALLDKLRDRIPGVAIRTTFIAGFPGETEREFQTLVNFVRSFGFDAMGVFPYSNEPGTPAHRMKGHLPSATIQERVEALMEAQQAVAFDKARRQVGRELRVLIDGFGRAGVYPARHAGQAPEVDGIVHLEGGEFDPGEFVAARVVAAREYDLVARPAGAGLPVLESRC